MPPTTETVANATASRVVALTTFPVTTRFCAGATDAAQRDSNVTADHEPLDITTARTARNRGTAYACRRVSRRAAGARVPGCSSLSWRAYCLGRSKRVFDIALPQRCVNGGPARTGGTAPS